MKKLKVGDRVAYYDSGFRDTGTIGACEPATSRVRIDPSGGWVHPKQCRRLIRKERRHVWVNPNPTSQGDLWRVHPGNNFVSPSKPNDGWIEFVEVRRPKRDKA